MITHKGRARAPIRLSPARHPRHREDFADPLTLDSELPGKNRHLSGGRASVGSRILHVIGGTRPLEPAPESPEARRRKAAGNWVGSLIFVLFLLLLIFWDAQTIYQHQWADVAGITVFAALFLIVPTRGAKWLRRVLRDRQSLR